MPVGRSADVDDVEIITRTELAEIMIALRIVPALLGVSGATGEVLLVDITERKKRAFLPDMGTGS
jgi:hypothetical protein